MLHGKLKLLYAQGEQGQTAAELQAAKVTCQDVDQEEVK
jgi:hypothetical protein